MKENKKQRTDAAIAKFQSGQPLTAMEKLLVRRRQLRSDAMVRRHADAGNTSVRHNQP
jgi:hypothetical protein